MLTVLIQSIVQYSLKKQQSMASVLNMAGSQRMLSQLVLKNFYECKYQTCDYSEMRIALNKLERTNKILQEGNAEIKLEVLQHPEIQNTFKELEPHLNFVLESLKDFNNYNNIPIPKLKAEVDSCLVKMEKIVNQFQKVSEAEINTLKIIEYELAALSLLVLLFEIFFIINPAIRKISTQNKKLKEISWHQSHAFNSHMQNLKDLQHVLKIEKKATNQQALVDCIIDELNDLEVVSKNMQKSIEEGTIETSQLDTFLDKFSFKEKVV
ncbi:MAG: type IV pili methyl-accepting chemotaxis transducer N-terminal domain-containing protein [Cellulophaga sp.]|nr:type IV pili methyl-accepting chemotaxis transducer N-terminal domain-containing protein [Cellulophaga sp.]